jgi:Glycosyl transferase family 2
LRWRTFIYNLIGRKVSAYARYFDEVSQLAPLPEDDGAFLSALPVTQKRTLCDIASIERSEDQTRRRLFVLNGNLNHDTDIQASLRAIHSGINRGDRVCLVVYNFYLAWLYRLANALNIRKGRLPSTFMTDNNLHHLCLLAGFQTVRIEYVCYFPWHLAGIGTFVNSVCSFLPLVRKLALVCVVLIRPVKPLSGRPSLALVVPARNEKGNIESAVRRLPDMNCETELIFVEGHSNDDTWEEIQRVAELYKSGPVRISTYRQTGKGKNDAVQLGFSHATSDLLTILDADLTMPPELLPRFYDAYCSGLGDFINGNRLVYPMEGEAMRPLNRMGNLFFAKALAWALKAPIGDSLCGTKLFAKRDWERFQKWKKDFGDFDPFGDFELIFPAQVLGLGIIDLPVRYRARTYGTTNISRFRHGLMLLRMTWVGFWKCR